MTPSSYPQAVLLAVIATTLIMPGCGDDHERAVVEQAEATAESDRPAPRAESIYDAEGNLRESNIVIAGLRLPMGLEEELRGERLHAFTTHVPPLRLRAYFSDQLMTGQIDDLGNGAVYRNAVPTAARGGVVKLDVSILPAGRARTRVEVREVPPPPAKMPTQEEAQEALERALERWNE